MYNLMFVYTLWKDHHNRVNQHTVVLLVAQLCRTLWNPMDYSLPGSSVHGILQARILEGIAIPFSKGSSWFRARTQVSYMVGRFFTIWATRETQLAYCLVSKSWHTLWDPVDWSPPRILCPWGFSRQNTRLGCHFLLQLAYYLGIILYKMFNLNLIIEKWLGKSRFEGVYEHTGPGS